MADYWQMSRGHTPQEITKFTHNGYEKHSDGFSKPGFTDGYEDHIYKRSVVTCDPIDGCVIKTETTVEEVHVPVMNMHGNISPAREGHVKVYGGVNNGWNVHESPPSHGQLKGNGHHQGDGYHKGDGNHQGDGYCKGDRNHQGDGYRKGDRNHQGDGYHKGNGHHKGDEYISRIQTEEGRTGKTGNTYWYEAPNSYGHGGRTSYETMTNGYKKPSGWEPHHEGSHGRDETGEGGFARQGHGGWTTPPTEFTTRKHSVTMAPTQSRVIPPNEEIFPHTIDSIEAARKYRGQIL